MQVKSSGHWNILLFIYKIIIFLPQLCSVLMFFMEKIYLSMPENEQQMYFEGYVYKLFFKIG